LDIAKRVAGSISTILVLLGLSCVGSATAAVPPESAYTWPHTFVSGRGSAIVYQPQVISWPERATLNTRIAVAVTPNGAKDTALGTIDVAFTTQTNLETRIVTLTDPKLGSTRFPTLETAQATRFEDGIRNALTTIGIKEIPLDTILLSLREQKEAPPEAPMKNDPPVIFHSERPASLVALDGEPVLAPIGSTPLSAVVNTNWDLFSEKDDHTWYLLNNGAWFAAPDYKGPWVPAPRLPDAFRAIPKDSNFSKVRAQIPGKKVSPRDMPTIFVSIVPAEIIVTVGPPRYEPIPGTSLKYAVNTTSHLFQESGGHLYYLVSGRWFSAPGLDGPWVFATGSLPPDFALIPPKGPKGAVLASVPGTPQAQDALIQAQIPQQGTLNRSTAKVEVVYAGEPKFDPIVGTEMFYAANTSFNVIRVGGAYYTCYRGAWFKSASPTGPWVLAESVPPVIYTIPASSPLYPVTYVRVYSVTPTTITYGYTAGYTMGFVSAGVVVYGTGWYYPPYVYPAPMPIYYPYPISYGCSVYYSSATGAWAHGGTVYGPYGGAVSGGTAYNPATGAWAHGAAVYGPNGGAGAWSAYNPSTGSYAHGSASWGTTSGSANASWYNARAGTTGSTNQNYNEYGRWGSTQVSGPNQTVNTSSRSNANGSAGQFHSTSGAEGAGVHGAGGKNAGVAKGANGDVYAGADGNVYKHTSSGWSKYDNGSWNPVTKPTNPNSGSQSNNLGSSQKGTGSGGQQRKRAGQSQGGSQSGVGSSASTRQLDQDRYARTEGQQRQQRFGQWRQSGGGDSFGGERGGGGRGAGLRRR
jgi:hypothetical protein